jgi:hypothetical protein
MPFYAWKNKKSGKIVEVERPMSHSHLPPGNDAAGWERVFAFGIGRVEGAGGSPARFTKVTEP